MSWRGFGRGRGGPWPGGGPFSYLPPWQRPGWLYGRGACWWLFNPYFQTNVPQIPSVIPPTTIPSTLPAAPFTLSKEQEAQMLEQEVKALEAHLDAMRKRLEELRR